MLKLWEIDFEPIWPVPHGLIILAETEKEAFDIARGEVGKVDGIKELPMEKGVVFFENGNY